MMITSESMTTHPSSAAPDPDTAWSAVLARDPRYDGKFVYAVRSTGVFCRPTCPSRRPQRQNVAFFAAPAEATVAGFRPCRRCRPEEPRLPLAEAMARVRAYIDERVDARLTLDALAKVADLSPAHLQRTFKAQFGLSPRAYQSSRRTDRFKEEVRRGRSVTDALYEAGYGSGSRLYESADARLGMTPGSYKRGGKGTKVRYTTAAAALGRVLVAATDRGVCAVQLGDSDPALEAALREEYPEAEIRRDDTGLRPSLAAILAHLDGEVKQLDLPLDVAATAFQWRVWHALQEIPYGETRSYAQVAEALGQPRAVRAVARACATNRVALLVPCHRVVRTDGSSGGYRWGEERKHRLLANEKAAASRGRRS
jgi:AraC family transcriptional regulator of adaptative response/methylated-DNA-[protein]-cysteine methyltransferase